MHLSPFLNSAMIGGATGEIIAFSSPSFALEEAIFVLRKV